MADGASCLDLDFTFSMNSLGLTRTKFRIEEEFFVKTHRWNTREYSSRLMDSKRKSICWKRDGMITIDVKNCL